MKVKDPAIELLAVVLYEHDSQDGYWPSTVGDRVTAWMKLPDEDREIYRRMARGEDEIPDNGS